MKILSHSPDRALQADILEKLYQRLNKRDFVHPDPLETLYLYDDIRDREIAGLVASSLAYGRVTQILKSVFSILRELGPSPSCAIDSMSYDHLTRVFAHFKHRFTTGEEVASMLYSVKRINKEYGSLFNCLKRYYHESDETILPSLQGFTGEIQEYSPLSLSFLLPSPSGGSACKRLNLFLRWMIRKDDVDPGGWGDLLMASKLVVPLDTHMFRICYALGMTGRNCSTMPAALDITRAFREISPLDPVKFDFALTRLGIRVDQDLQGFLCSMGCDRQTSVSFR